MRYLKGKTEGKNLTVLWKQRMGYAFEVKRNSLEGRWATNLWQKLQVLLPSVVIFSVDLEITWRRCAVRATNLSPPRSSWKIGGVISVDSWRQRKKRYILLLFHALTGFFLEIQAALLQRRGRTIGVEAVLFLMLNIATKYGYTKTIPEVNMFNRRK